MQELEVYEMMEITGGISITGTLLSALGKVANTIMDAGRALGSALRRISSNNLCSCK